MRKLVVAAMQVRTLDVRGGHERCQGGEQGDATKVGAEHLENYGSELLVGECSSFEVFGQRSVGGSEWEGAGERATGGEENEQRKRSSLID